MKSSEITLLTGLSRPTLHPDRTRAVVAASRPDVDSDAYVGQLWSVPLNGADPRRITRGKHDGSPRFSPDGTLLAFIRSAGDGPGQIFVMAADGGEPVQATEAELGVDEYRWSPDSRQLLFTALVPEEGRYGTIKELGATAEPPRRITTQRYRQNGLGFTTDRRSHVFLTSVPDVAGEPVYDPAPSVDDPKPEKPKHVHPARQLTFGDYSHTSIAFAPDGNSIAFVSARHESRDLILNDDVFTLDLLIDEAEPTLFSAPGATLGFNSISFAPDGAIFAIAGDLGPTGRDFVGLTDQLYLLEAGKPAAMLSEPASVDLGPTGGELGIIANDALVLNATRGRVQLLRVTREGDVSVLVGGDVEVTALDVSEETVVVRFSSAISFGDLGIPEGGNILPISNFSKTLVEGGLIEPQEVVIIARDGYPVHGWTLTPTGEGPHPVILLIHGGPFAQWSVSVFDEAQVYADAGYAVAMCNPRGSAGYGREHGRSIRHRMGTVDFIDVIDFLDGTVAEHPDFDGSRVGIMGGSYGGYLTAWTIAHDHRFAGAIVERGYLDPESFVGTSDIGSFFSDEYTGTDPAEIAAQSPQAFVGQVTTPTLVIHSDEDLRCPLFQAERYYASLRRNGVHSELLIFPGENHELSRSGRPRHRVQRFDAVLDWWARYLPVGPRS